MFFIFAIKYSVVARVSLRFEATLLTVTMPSVNRLDQNFTFFNFIFSRQVLSLDNADDIAHTQNNLQRELEQRSCIKNQVKC